MNPDSGIKTPRLLTTGEVAKILRVSRGFVTDHSIPGRSYPQIPRVKLGRAVRFREEDVQAFIDQCSLALQKGGK